MPRRTKGLMVDVSGDISGLRQAMNEAVREFNSAQRAIKNLEKASELDGGNDINLLKDKLNAYEIALKKNKQSLIELEKIQQKIINSENFKKGITDYTERFTALQKEYARLNNEQKNLIKGIKQINLEISNSTFNQKWRKITESINESKKSLDSFKKATSDISEAIKFDPDNIDLYRQKQSLLARELNEVDVQLKNLEKEKKLLSSPLFHKATEEETNRLAENRKETEILTQRKKELNAQMKSEYVDRFNTKMAMLGNTLVELGNSTRVLSRAFQGLLASSFNASKSYESDIANIRRVVKNLTDETVNDLKTLAIETGTAFTNIAEYATIAGALGIEEEKIAKFAETMTDLNTATGGVFSGEEGAKGIAVFLKQLNLGIDEAENFGSAIAVIGDKYADIGDETVRVATKMSGLSSIINTNQYELIGLAGVMADLGLSGETNANAINRAFLQIDKVLAGGVKKADEKLASLAETAGMTSAQFRKAWGQNAVDAFLSFTDGLKSSVFNDINKAIATSDTEVEKFAKTLNMSAEQFKRAWGEDNQAVFNSFVEALGEMDEDGEVASKVLADLGISSVNTAQTMLRLAGSGNEVRKAIDLTNQAWNENTALTEKSNIIYETTERKLQGFYESLKQLGGILVDNVLPYVKDLIDKGVDLAKEFKNMNPHLQKLTLAFIALGAGLSPVSKAFGNIFSFFFKPTWLNGLTKFESTMKGLGLVLNSPFGVVAGMTALVGLAYSLGQAYQENTVFYKMNEDLKNLSSMFKEVSDIADDRYLSSLENINELSEKQLTDLDNLIAKYRDTNTPLEERGEILSKIKDYVNEMNSQYGYEEFYWDSATKSIKAHADGITDTKQAYLDYINEVKKQNWLEAHAEEYRQAQEGLLQVESDMRQSTADFFERMKEIPKTYLEDFMEAAKGTETVQEAMDNFQATMSEKGYSLTEQQLADLRNAYADWNITLENAKSAVADYQQAIKDYQAVQEGSSADFEEITKRIEESRLKAMEYTETTKQNDEEIYNFRDLIATRISNQDETMGYMLEKLDKEITNQEIMKGIIDNQYASMTSLSQEANAAYSTVDSTIKEWENWQPSAKNLVINVTTVGGSIRGDYNSNGGAWTSNRSGGFGELYSNISRSIANSMANYNSGGYVRGGLTVNANFVVNNANNLDHRKVATLFIDGLVGEINDALGMEI